MPSYLTFTAIVAKALFSGEIAQRILDSIISMLRNIWGYVDKSCFKDAADQSIRQDDGVVNVRAC